MYEKAVNTDFILRGTIKVVVVMFGFETDVGVLPAFVSYFKGNML